ncbi:FCD domain-containing protein [Cupriavidus necator]|uniref:FadR/GntR family transcriptional regulator n=1 Tax=Cupriavidus necator TaxID=106590 RepID=UPI00339D858A
MAMFREGKSGAIEIRKQKRADLVAEELKRLITQRNLRPGDRLPQEGKLQQMFSVSKSTIREALKSLEVQGLISVTTGPAGGGTIVEVPLDRTFQLMQNYLFFKDVGIADIYTVRRLLEPELAAGAVPHLTEEDFSALERTIDLCDPASAAAAAPLLDQRQEDLTFHDILAAANPNPMLRFCCELINEMIRQLVVFGNDTPACEHERFGAANVKFHKRIVKAARDRDAEAVRSLMSAHMEECTHYVTRMNGRIHGRLVLDSEMPTRSRPMRADEDNAS